MLLHSLFLHSAIESVFLSCHWTQIYHPFYSGKHSIVRMHNSLFNETFIDGPFCCPTAIFVISCDHSSLCTMHLLHASLLQSSPRNGNTDQMLCTFNILVPVVKLCFFLNVFPSIFSSPSSGRALLSNLAVSYLSRPWPYRTGPNTSITHVDGSLLFTGEAQSLSFHSQCPAWLDPNLLPQTRFSLFSCASGCSRSTWPCSSFVEYHALSNLF